MKKFYLSLLASTLAGVTFAQTVTWGESNSRTDFRDDAGLMGQNGAISGFYQTYSPANFPTGANSWWHLLDVRHSNGSINYAMQFSGSFFDQELYFRKTNNNAQQSWFKVILENPNGQAGVYTDNPIATFQVDDGTNMASIGSAAGQSLNFGTSYLGFNAARSNGNWTTYSDGANNGGGLIYADIFGDIYFAPIKYTGNNTQSLSDASITNAIALKIDRNGITHAKQVW